jgi:hypothetical protein
MKLAVLPALAAVLLLGGCVTPGHPESGEESVYDGFWEADLPPAAGLPERCAGSVVKFEVRYGFARGKVYNHDYYKADVWGYIGADGVLDGKLGARGYAAADAQIKLNGDEATGTWSTDTCWGKVIGERVQAAQS